MNESAMAVTGQQTSSPKALLKWQIGPVQEFIAQARSTRDLWSGSYLLSWLMAAGLHELTGNGEVKSGDVVYPHLNGQPLMDFRVGNISGQGLSEENQFKILTPNLPNIAVAIVPAEKAAGLGGAVEKAIRDEWQQIAAKCKEGAASLGLDCRRFQQQVDRFLSISWQVIPFSESDYAGGYKEVSTLLDAVRQTRAFRAWSNGGWEHGALCNKDTLTGKEETLIGGSEWWELWEKNRSQNGNGEDADLWPILLRRKHKGDMLGAITLIKRTWHWFYLNQVHGLKSLHVSEAAGTPTQFPFPSTFHIASHDPSKTENDETREPEDDSERLDRYFAVLAFDGDDIGKWVGGAKADLTRHFHADFSRRLSQFALHCVRPIVNACDGRLIYAGGDDVLALLPADTALPCAKFLRQAYRGETGFVDGLKALAEKLHKAHQATGRGIKLASGHSQPIHPDLTAAMEGELFAKTADGKLTPNRSGNPLDLPGCTRGNDDSGNEIRPDASVGIAIAHYKNPLQDTVRAAQKAEWRAKNVLGRAAFSSTLVKRSGETIEWGCPWESLGLELYEHLLDGLREKKISSRFPYRVVELLSPYHSRQTLEDVPDFPVKEIIEKEWSHVMGRQHGGQWDPSFGAECVRKLGNYLGHFADPIKSPGFWSTANALNSVMGLCQTAAFTRPRLADETQKGTP